MAATLGFTTEITSKVSAARLFKFGPVEGHKHVSQTMPHMFTENTHSNGHGVGSIRFFRFKEGHPFSHIKVHMDVVDMENYEVKFTMLEGGNIGKKLASAVYCYKMAPTDDGGCVCKITGEFIPLPGVEFTGKDIEEEKEFYKSIFKALEKYLLENPDAYA